MASLKHQFLTCIDRNFSEKGSDKHSAKHSQHSGKEETMSRVWSFAERKSLIDISSQLAIYCKEEFKIRQIKDISSNHIQKFLESKADTCNNTSLSNYVSRINKLEVLVNKTFSSADVSWRGEIVAPISSINVESKLRNVFMTIEDYNKLIDYFKDKNTNAKYALELSGMFGLRASECEKLQLRDCDFHKMELHIIGSKGGKNRDIPITPENALRLKEIIQERGLINQTDRIVGIYAESIDRRINEACKNLGLTQYCNGKSSIHSCRKLWASSTYEKFMEQGYSKKDALNKTSKLLGHGSNRHDIAQAYIKNL
jgi:integrase